MLAPIHSIQLSSRTVSGKFEIALRPQLPIAGIDLIVGNDLAGKVFLSPDVIENPIADLCVPNTVAPDSPLFPVCAVTHAQAQKLGDLVDLSNSFMTASDPTSSAPEVKVVVELQPDDKTVTLPVDRTSD